MRRGSWIVHQKMPFEGTLHPGSSDDMVDPRVRGILQKTRCRPYREKLRSIQQANIMQGLMIVTSAATVLAVLGFNYMDLALGHDLTQVEIFGGTLQSVWLGVVGLLGLSGKLGATKEETARALYCNQKLDAMGIFRQLSRQVLNQEHALARFEKVMKSPSNFKSVALLGPPGVGKSLTAMGLRQQFPWQENVHTYSWSTYVPDGVHKFHLIRNFVEHLSDCGQNLLIIDNLSTCDYGIVPIYNKLLIEREGDFNAAVNQTVLVVYIFNLEMEYYWQQFELLQQLPVETTIINYRPFGRDELTDCLQQELRLEQRTLDQGRASQILEEALLNVQCTGCKGLRHQVFEYGQHDPNR